MNNDYGTGNNHNHRKRVGRHTDRSRLDDAAGDVRCVQRVRLRHPQGYTLYLQKHGIVGKRNEAVQDNGINYDVYSLEMVIAVSFKLRSRESVAFRRFIMGKLYAANRKEPLYLFFSPAAYIRKAPSC